MEHLCKIKETLISVVCDQLNRIEEVDAREMGEVIDMIKDLSETIYYCTIVDSMGGSCCDHKTADLLHPTTVNS